MLPFAKYQGIGNDFVVVDLRDAGGPSPSPSPQTPEAARAMCDRRFGVGADGVLPILPPTRADADVRMRVLNADGSEAEMCGNGIRCVAVHMAPLLGKDIIRVDTLAGLQVCTVAGDDVSVDMGRPVYDTGALERPLAIAGANVRLTSVSMGNPHAVAFVDEGGAPLRALAERVGPPIETHAWFPAKTNVEFARVVSPRELELVVWERGCGITLACGTGACATVVAACLTGRATPGETVAVRLLGGTLHVTVAPGYSTVTMRGPAKRVYDGSIDLAALLA
jgi:diaminopimelate epimerase